MVNVYLKMSTVMMTTEVSNTAQSLCMCMPYSLFTTADGWLGTNAQHVERRKRALVHYEIAAQDQIKKQTRNKRVRLQAYVVGDYVTVRVPPQDRMSPDLPRLPAVIVEVRGGD